MMIPRSALLVMALTVTGCSGPGGQRHTSLSTAMGAAAGNHDRRIDAWQPSPDATEAPVARPTPTPAYAWQGGDSGAAHPGVQPPAVAAPVVTPPPAGPPPPNADATTSPSALSTPPPPAETIKGTIGLRPRVIWVDDDSVERITALDLVVSFRGDSAFTWDLFVGGEQYALRPGSTFDRGANDAVAGIVGLEGRWEPWGSDQPIAPYIGGGLGLGYLLWSYRQDLTDAAGETVSSDGMEFYSVAVAAGLRIGRPTGPMALLEVSPSLRIYGQTTAAGFSNDLLTTTAGLGVSCALALAW